MDLTIQLSVDKGKVLCKTHWILRLQIPHQYSDDVDSSSDQNGLTVIPEEWRRSKVGDFLLANQPQAPIQTRAHTILIFLFRV